MAHSFTLTFRDQHQVDWGAETFTAAVDSKEQKEMLLTAIDVLSKAE